MLDDDDYDYEQSLLWRQSASVHSVLGITWGAVLYLRCFAQIWQNDNDGDDDKEEEEDESEYEEYHHT